MTFQVKVGDQLHGRFTVLDVLVDTDVERVARCRDTLLDREVLLEATGDALEAIPTSDGMQRAMREAWLLARLKAPGIPTVLDVIEGTTGPILVMDSYAGETLASRLERTGALPANEVRSLLLDLSRALAAVHGGKVTHRNVSSSHVILNAEGGVSLRGFRFAKRADRAAGHSSLRLGRERRERDARAREVLPDHAAPEQHGGTPSSARTDLFALGCVLYEAASGKPAFPDGTGRGRRQPDPLRRLAPELDAGVLALINECLAIQPGLRPASAQAIVDRLEGGGRRGRSWVMAGVVATAGAGVLAAGLWGGLIAGRSSVPEHDDPDAPVSDEKRGVEAVNEGTERDFGVGFRQSRALVIGISDYESLPKLENAASDAKAMVQVLKRLEWDVELLIDGDATEEGITKAFGQLVRDVDSEDRLLFYFAGHGSKSRLSDDVGHLQPVGAKRDNPTTWISFECLKDLRSDRGAKHSLALLDCCYSGVATSGWSGGVKRSGSVEAAEAWTQEQAWVVITSGLATETVEDSWFSESKRLDHSPFAHAVLKVLTKEKRAVTAQELVVQVDRTYRELGVQEQSTTFLREPKQSKGRFVFFLGDN
ncbi:MAG: caspase family protein [Planctomycetota bacterium]